MLQLLEVGLYAWLPEPWLLAGVGVASALELSTAVLAPVEAAEPDVELALPVQPPVVAVLVPEPVLELLVPEPLAPVPEAAVVLEPEPPPALVPVLDVPAPVPEPVPVLDPVPVLVPLPVLPVSELPELPPLLEPVAVEPVPALPEPAVPVIGGAVVPVAVQPALDPAVALVVDGEVDAGVESELRAQSILLDGVGSGIGASA